MKRYAVIVAGGSGKRMGSDVAKQFLLLNNLPILMHTLTTFNHVGFDKIVLVLPQTDINFWESLVVQYSFKIEHHIVVGGDTRFQSVKNGVMSLPPQEALVAVHDGVRALIRTQTIENILKHAAANGNAIPVIPIVDSLREISNIDNKPFDRNKICAVQTPQCFMLSQLQQAFLQTFQDVFTDEATVMQYAGHCIHLVQGEEDNIKITRPIDLIIAEHVLKQRQVS